MLLSPFNKLMLSRYAGVSTIPVYEIAFNGSMQVRALIAVGLSALMPEVSRIGANMTGYARDRIAQLNYRAIKLILLFGLPVYAGLFVFCTFLFRIWLRERFVTVLPDAFRIMLIATFASLLSVPAYYTLLGLGRVRQCFYAYSIQAGTNALVVLLVILLSPTFSVVHVAWAVLTATVVTTLYLNSQYAQRV
jgi:O-antigen/teichoic acid export membrane protein